MSRVRASNYEVKYQAILDSAAALFAAAGYPAVKLQDVARDCGATKSMLYHYFPTKDDLLLALLSEHLDRLQSDIEDVLTSARSSTARFDAFIGTYVKKSVQSRQRHLSAMNDVKFLPGPMQAALRAKQKAVTDQVAGLLRALKPGLPPATYKPYAMFLLGMLNWLDLWFDPNGPIGEDEICQRISRLFRAGFLAES